ncbi:MAG: DUF2807 domain-containing protein [Winogradskyella sp.]|uniref:GIN domain-containing protein n=1 Tax=Winogradskyella sp. TaxID=1883156 RepID=UPI000F3BF445|nr:DUF2807 domain-containing protein [Winogradskyella sp.]RNC84835.1 MAG: DUF2807 domain-containing protein [Winogradskyella sp.]
MISNKLIYSFFALLLISQVSFSQSKEKIKGNRDVTIKQTYTDAFSSLIIKNDFEVKLAFNSKPSVEIEADDNLHAVIDVNVTDGTLSISTNKRITSKKKLLITVNYGSELNNIQIYNSAEVRSLTSMELENLDLKIENNARAYLNVKSTLFNFEASERTKSRLNVTADSTSFVLSGNSKLDALLNSKSSTFDLYQSADATIEGDGTDTNLRIDNSANFSGKNYTITNADLLIESNSVATLNVATYLNLKASGSTAVYVYGEPKITLEVFTNTAKLQKKDINAKGLF